MEPHEAREPLQLPPSVSPTELQLPPGTTHWGTDLEKMAATEKSMLTAANKTPDVVKAALSPKTPAIGNLRLHTFTVQTYINLEEINSPFIDRAPKPDEWIPPVKEIRNALYVMFEADEKVAEEISRGLDVFTAAAVKFARDLSMADLGAYSVAINMQIAQGFAPAAKMDPPKTQGGEENFPCSATGPAGC